MTFEWEEINNLPSCVTYRAKVWGEWIVNNLCVTTTSSEGTQRMATESMVFIPDPNHEWSIEE